MTRQTGGWHRRRPFGASLTDLDVAVLRRLALGRTQRAVAAELSIGETTVSNHVRSTLDRLGAINTTNAVAMLDDYRPGWRERIAIPAWA